MRYLWTEDTGAGLHFWKLVNQLFFDNELAVESKRSNQGLLDAVLDLNIKERIKTELVKGTNLVYVTLIMKMGNVIENVIEILKKIKWLKSEYSKKKLSKERLLKSFLKNEYFKVSLNEVSRDLRLSETL